MLISNGIPNLLLYKYTSSWLALSALFSSTMHSFVMSENANTLMPQWQATSTSGMVLIPIKNMLSNEMMTVIYYFLKSYNQSIISLIIIARIGGCILQHVGLARLKYSYPLLCMLPYIQKLLTRNLYFWNFLATYLQHRHRKFSTFVVPQPFLKCNISEFDYKCFVYIHL